ncbi:MAG: hypothetical protein SGJ20_01305, partial [Planctomycetota bacterium]|nr:hypothetical protein [Planctomycetota bacterium]
MIPFTTNCTTCKAPLRVTSAAAIGQILACPKCNSMVCIELPAPEVPEVPSEPVRRSRLFRKSDSTTASKSPIEMDAASSSSGSISRSSQKAATGKNLGAFEELIELAATMLPGGAAPGSEVAASENPTAASADVKKSKLPVAKSLDKSDIKKAAAIAASAAVVATLSKETTASPAQTAAKVPPACTPGITSAVPHAGAASVTTHAPALAAKVTALPPPLPNTPLVASTASAETVSRALLTQSWVGITAASVAVLSIAIGGWLLWSYSGSETEPTVAVTDQQAQDNASKQPDGAPEDKADAAARQEKNGTAGQLAGTGKVDIAAAAKTNQPITPGTENSVAPAGSTPPAAPEAAVNGAAPAAQPTVASSATEIAQAAGAPPPAAKLRLEPVENAAAGRPANGLPLVPDNEKVPEAVSTTPVTDGTGGDATGADPDKDAAVGAAGESDQTAEDVPVAVLARRIEPRQVVVG